MCLKQIPGGFDGAYPSGHTTYGYTGAVLLAILVPERYQEMIARGAEYGNDRILMGSHYVMDVMGGRALALYDLAHLLANDPNYINQQVKRAPRIKDFRAAIKAARADVTKTLETACGETIQDCAREDTGRLNNPAANEAFYASTQTYNLPVVYSQQAGTQEDITKLAPEAGYLLTAAFPSLTLEQADRILTETEGPCGGFLDNGTSFGVYSRINLYAAAGRASALSSAQPSGARPTVSGWTRINACFHPHQSRRNTAQNNLSERANRGCGRRPFKTASCCRSARFSKIKSRRERKKHVSRVDKSLRRRSMRPVLHDDNPSGHSSDLLDSIADRYFGEPQDNRETHPVHHGQQSGILQHPTESAIKPGRPVCIRAAQDSGA
jgi:hypothetical protein